TIVGKLSTIVTDGSAIRRARDGNVRRMKALSYQPKCDSAFLLFLLLFNGLVVISCRILNQIHLSNTPLFAEASSTKFTTINHLNDRIARDPHLVSDFVSR